MPTYDPVKAKELAQQYEQKYGKPLEFNYLLTPQPEVMAQGQAGQQQFKDIGVKMNLKSEDQATLINDVILGNYQATGFILFGSNTLDVNYVFIAATTVHPPGQISLNFTRNDDPVLTQALDDARKTGDRDRADRPVQDRPAADGQGPQLHLPRAQRRGHRLLEQHPRAGRPDPARRLAEADHGRADPRPGLEELTGTAESAP